jgi:molybdenum cofactor cytidylyltransferase
LTAGVIALVLAAGSGRRMGSRKHLLEIEGVPMLARVLRALAASQAASVVCALRPDDPEGAALAAGEGAAIAFVERADEGRSASIRAAVEAAPAGASGFLIALADQPFLGAADFDALIEAHRSAPAAIVHASYGGRRGSPALFPASERAALLSLRGEEGGRVLFGRAPGRLRAVALDPAHGRDLDIPEDLGASPGR